MKKSGRKPKSYSKKPTPKKAVKKAGKKPSSKRSYGY